MASIQEPVAASATPASGALKKKKSIVTKAKGAKKATASHPPTAAMVGNVIKSLNERGGSSLAAIKKAISSTYKLDAEKLAPFIRKYLKSAVDSGVLIRTKGKGASGSFKIAPKSKAEPKKKSSTEKKPATKKDAKPKVTKAKSPKKPAAAKKVVKTKTAVKKAPAKSKKIAAPKSPKTTKPKKAKVAPKKVKKTIKKK